MGGLYLELAPGTSTAMSVNKSVGSGGHWGKVNNFSFVGPPTNLPRSGCQQLGDINIRVAPSDDTESIKGAGNTPWAIYDSAFGSESSWQQITRVDTTSPNVLIAHDISAVLNASEQTVGFNNSLFDQIPLKVKIRVI